MYDVDRVMRALKAAGVTTAIWVTLRETTSNYAQVERADPQRRAAVAEEPRRRRLERVQPRQAVVPGGRPAPHGRPVRWASRGSCDPWSSRAPRRRSSAVPTVLHSGVEPGRKFPLAAHVSGWTTSADLSTGRPRAGITSERMFCSPCTGRSRVPRRPIGRGRSGRLDSRPVRTLAFGSRSRARRCPPRGLLSPRGRAEPRSEIAA